MMKEEVTLQTIMAPYHRQKLRLDCGHRVTLGYFLGANVIISMAASSG